MSIFPTSQALIEESIKIEWIGKTINGVVKFLSIPILIVIIVNNILNLSFYSISVEL